MDSKGLNMNWFMPFEEPAQEHTNLEQPSEGSSYSSVSEYDMRSGSIFHQPQMVKESPTMIPMSPSDVMMDEIWSPGRRESSSSTQQGDKTQTSSRRRAQNRAAQRAFRERKEKRARDLEEQLASVTEKYKELESDYTQLQQSYDKLQQTLELLTCDDDGRTSGEQLRRFLDIIQGKARTKAKPGA